MVCISDIDQRSLGFRYHLERLLRVMDRARTYFVTDTSSCLGGHLLSA